MKKFYISVMLCICSGLFSAGQNVNLQVVITKLERTAYVDCIACGDPDPTWKIQGIHNGLGALTFGPYCWHYDNMNPTLWDIADYNIMNITNTNATNFTLGFNDAFEKSCSNNNCTYEGYNFFTCFPSVNGDDRRCQNTSLVNINFRQSAPCSWHTQNSAFCGDYRFEYSFYWSFNYAPALVTQPPTNTLLCLGDSTTLTVVAANDINGWNTGVNYQWQVSTSTACPGTGWIDIFAATSPSFKPSQIPGTRLYRCKVSANCNPDFSSNTTITSCAAVTYNPIGSPGDPVPDIVSGICGSTVLPGSVHLLGIPLAPNAGAVIGATDYAWTANGGSPTNYNGQVFTWTAPTNPGTYTINLTYLDNCPQPDAQANACVVNVGSSTCEFAYVATYGQDSVYRGGPDNPYKTLEYALSQLNGRKYIRIATGIYNEANPLFLQNDLVIEGGYKVNGNIWSKNNSDSTTIIGNGLVSVSNDVAHRVCFVSNGTTNWRLQDLVIKSTDVSLLTPNGRGYSNYAVLALNNSTGFEIVRCKIYAGNAAKGLDGFTPGGAGSAGGSGTGGNGGNGSSTGCNGNGSGGSGGTAGNGGASAGSAGNGCGGSGCNIFGCNASGCSAAGGVDGGNGAAGAGFSAGVRPLTPSVVSPYYTPAGQSLSGSNGFGGGGGGGGGGGDEGTCCSGGSGSGGTPNGGRGGNGGGGGLAGSGGRGGGGSFGIYASGGSTGTLTTTLVLAGNFGLGGDGAVGQSGASGQTGANGVNHGGNDGGVGGDGGNGGAGGNGGRGQDGANGFSQAVATAGGASITGSSTGVPNTFVVGVNYQNSKACINSEIEMTKSSGVWTFPSGMNFVNDLRDYPAGFPVSSYNASSTPVLVYTSTSSVEYDLTINGNVYAKYISIASDNRALPAITTSASTICIDGIDTLNATHWGTEVEYDWRIYQATNVNSPLYQSTLPSPVINFYGFAAGLYTVRYRVRESCCGWSKAVFDTIRIMPAPVLFNVYGGGNYCPGSAGAVVNLSGSEPGVKYILLYNGNAVDSIIGAGGPLAFAPQTGVGNYTVIAIRFADCSANMFGTASIGQYPAPQTFVVSGSDTLCLQGAHLSATIKLDGSELGTNYQLLRSGNLPVGAPVPGTGLPMQFSNITQAGVYTIFASNPVTGCTAYMIDSAVIELALPPVAENVVGGGAYCAGDSGVMIGLNTSEPGTVYQLLQGGVLPSVPAILGTGAAIAFDKVSVAGYYKVKATGAHGCDNWMNDSAWVRVMNLPVITSVLATDVACSGSSNGVITVGAVSPNGSLTYSIDSAANYTASNVFAGLSVSSFNVFVKDDSGCVARYVANPVQVNTSANSGLVITSVLVTDVVCAGNANGSIAIQAYSPNGSLFYSIDSAVNYSANNVFTGLPTSYNHVFVKDASGCVARYFANPVQVKTAPSSVAINSVVVTDVVCAGNANGTIAIQAYSPNGSLFYSIDSAVSYSANPVFAGLPASHNNVFVKDDSGCVARYFANPVLVKTAPVSLQVSSVTTTAVKCSGDANGTISIYAVHANGSLVYSVDSAVTYSVANPVTLLPASYYHVFVKDDSGCVAAYTANPVQVLSPSPLVLAMHGVNPDCFGNTTGSAMVSANGGTPAYTYVWNTNPVQTDFSIDNLAANASYSVTVSDANNCTAQQSVTLVEPAKVLVNVYPDNVKCFEGNNGSVSIAATGGLPPYDYYLNGIYQSDSFFTDLVAGHFLATAQDANHCVSSATFTITQPKAFTVSAGPDIISSHGQTVQLLGSASSLNGIIGYFWTPDFHIECDTCPHPMVSPDTTTTYILTAMDGDSCTGFDSVTVFVKNAGPYYIPSAFTPNNDGLNDYFEMNILGAEVIQVSIYNRWGELVYHNPNQHNGMANNGDAWDGKKGGKLLPYDTYTYMLQVHFFDHSDETITGTVTLMK